MYSCKYIIILQKFYSYTYSFNYTLNFKKVVSVTIFEKLKLYLSIQVYKVLFIQL